MTEQLREYANYIDLTTLRTPLNQRPKSERLIEYSESIEETQYKKPKLMKKTIMRIRGTQ